MKQQPTLKCLLALVTAAMSAAQAAAVYGNESENGFVSLFNGKDLSGWQGAKDAYIVKDGVLIAKKSSHGNLLTDKEYSNFILRLEFRNEPGGNNGVGLRTTLQGVAAYKGIEIQILDDDHPSYKDLKPEQFTGAVYGAVPVKRGHLKPAWQWNTMEIVADGPHVKVTLNGVVVTEADLSKVGYKEIHGHVLEGLMRPNGYIALCGHYQHTEFRNIRIKELEDCEEGFLGIFDGKTLKGWQGDVKGYAVEDGMLVCTKKGGRINSEKQYGDFVLRFDFKFQAGANNGVALRAPLDGDPAYVGMECQILDDSAPVYKSLKPYQYHGSIYGIFPARRGALNPPGQWNSEEIVCDGTKIKVTLNGTVIVDADLATVENGTMDGKDHPGRFRKEGHIGFTGHGHRVEIRNPRIKVLEKDK